MFKLIVIIDCDRCNDSFRRVALSTDRGPVAWRYLTADLEMTAEAGGWNIYNPGNEHLCNDCFADMRGEADQSKALTTNMNDDCPF